MDRNERMPTRESVHEYTHQIKFAANASIS